MSYKDKVKHREYAKRWRKNHPEKAKEVQKKWESENQDKVRERWQRNDKKKWIDYLRKQEEMAGRKKPKLCELCGRDGRICFDHDHKTGKFRGWLCLKCNTVLGSVNDDVKILQMLIEYLKRK